MLENAKLKKGLYYEIKRKKKKNKFVVFIYSQ